jgi:hypothetical protein
VIFVLNSEHAPHPSGGMVRANPNPNPNPSRLQVVWIEVVEFGAADVAKNKAPVCATAIVGADGTATLTLSQERVRVKILIGGKGKRIPSLPTLLLHLPSTN